MHVVNTHIGDLTFYLSNIGGFTNAIYGSIFVIMCIVLNEKWLSDLNKEVSPSSPDMHFDERM